MDHFTRGAQAVIEEQGWDDESLRALFSNFLDEKKLQAEFAVFLARQAELENAEAKDVNG